MPIVLRTASPGNASDIVRFKRTHKQLGLSASIPLNFMKQAGKVSTLTVSLALERGEVLVTCTSVSGLASWQLNLCMSDKNRCGISREKAGLSIISSYLPRFNSSWSPRS